MKVKDLLEIQGIIDNRIIPSDMNDNKLNEHYSQSKDEFMSILDMDLIHLVRSYSKCLDGGKINNKELLGQQISIIERAVRIIEQQL
jgi:hypothetical protein